MHLLTKIIKYDNLFLILNFNFQGLKVISIFDRFFSVYYSQQTLNKLAYILCNVLLLPN